MDWEGSDERGRRILKDIRLPNSCRAYQQQIRLVYVRLMRHIVVFGDVEIGSQVDMLEALLHGLVMAGELV